MPSPDTFFRKKKQFIELTNNYKCVDVFFIAFLKIFDMRRAAIASSKTDEIVRESATSISLKYSIDTDIFE